MYPPPPEFRKPSGRWYPPAPAESGYSASEVHPVMERRMNLAEFLFSRLNDKNRRKPLQVNKGRTRLLISLF